MPKDNRSILSGVRVGSTVYTEGMEDELSSVLDQAGLDRLTEKGALAGDWKAVKAAKKTAADEGNEKENKKDEKDEKTK